MKKISTLVVAGLFTMLSATAFACPKGTSLSGGTGPNHKGGKCVPTMNMAKHKAMQQDKTKTKQVAEKSQKANHMTNTDTHKTNHVTNADTHKVKTVKTP